MRFKICLQKIENTLIWRLGYFFFRKKQVSSGKSLKGKTIDLYNADLSNLENQYAF